MKQILTGLLFAALLATGCAAAQPKVAPGGITLEMKTENSVLAANRTQPLMVRIAISAPALPPQHRSRLQGVNLAIAFDSSSSMHGEKIVHARQAARNALAQLGDDDIFSLVNYNHSVEVLIPPTRINAAVRRELESIIDSIQPQGTTALFGGVSLAAEQLRKMDRSNNRVQRLILLSDGRANVGPSSPAELGRLGAALVKEGISVSTIGIGNDYNEDLMTSLAQNSDGNFYFVARSSDLPEILARELDSALAVAAQKLKLKITCPAGVIPRGILGFDCKVDGQTILLDFNQIYAGHDKVLLLQLEVPEQPKESVLSLGTVELACLTADGVSKTLTTGASVRFSDDESVVKESLDTAVRADVVLQQSNIAREIAIKEADAGNFRRAAERLRQAQGILAESASFLDNDALQEDAKKLKDEAEKLEHAENAPAAYSEARKEIKGRKFQLENSQPVRQ